MLILKGKIKRLGNVFFAPGDQGETQESLDYGINHALDEMCPYGDPSIRLVTVASLPGQNRSVVIQDQASSRGGWAAGRCPSAGKVRRQQGDQRRIGLPGCPRCFRFSQSPDRRSGNTETAKRLVSDFWKRRLSAARPSIAIPDTTVLELPWDAAYLSPQDLATALAGIGFPEQPNLE